MSNEKSAPATSSAKYALEIDRKKWLRGEGARVSRLLRPSDGKMCCLGLYLLSLGVSEDELLDRETPQFPGLPEPARWLHLGGDESIRSSACSELMRENDAENEDADREKRISRVFADVGVKVTFHD